MTVREAWRHDQERYQVANYLDHCCRVQGYIVDLRPAHVDVWMEAVHTLLQRIVKPFLLDTTNHRHKLAIFFPFREPEGVHRVESITPRVVEEVEWIMPRTTSLNCSQLSTMGPSTRTISCAHSSHINRRRVTNRPSKC